MAEKINKIDPKTAFSDLQNKAAGSKDAALHPAGPKGMDKLKLGVLNILHKTLSKTRNATKWSSDEGAGISTVIGGGILGIGLMSGLSFQEMMMSSTSLVPVWGARAVVAAGALTAVAGVANKVSADALKKVIAAERKLNNKLSGQPLVIANSKGGR